LWIKSDGDPLDPNEEDKKPPEYYEIIVETGFYMYFLICSYMEIDDIDPGDFLFSA
jgi:hypothetical protein